MCGGDAACRQITLTTPLYIILCAAEELLYDVLRNLAGDGGVDVVLPRNRRLPQRRAHIDAGRGGRHQEEAEANAARHRLRRAADRRVLRRLSAARARAALPPRQIRVLHVQRPFREPVGLQNPRGQRRMSILSRSSTATGQYFALFIPSVLPRCLRYFDIVGWAS